MNKKKIFLIILVSIFLFGLVTTRTVTRSKGLTISLGLNDLDNENYQVTIYPTNDNLYMCITFKITSSDNDDVVYKDSISYFFNEKKYYWISFEIPSEYSDATSYDYDYSVFGIRNILSVA